MNLKRENFEEFVRSAMKHISFEYHEDDPRYGFPGMQFTVSGEIDLGVDCERITENGEVAIIAIRAGEYLKDKTHECYNDMEGYSRVAEVQVLAETIDLPEDLAYIINHALDIVEV